MGAIAKNAHVVCYAHPSLQTDEDFLLQAIKKNAIVFKHLSLKGDRKFVLQAIEMNYRVFIHVEDPLKRSPEFILQAIETDERVSNFIDSYQAWLIADASTQTKLVTPRQQYF